MGLGMGLVVFRWSAGRHARALAEEVGQEIRNETGDTSTSGRTGGENVALGLVLMLVLVLVLVLGWNGEGNGKNWIWSCSLVIALLSVTVGSMLVDYWVGSW